MPNLGIKVFFQFKFNDGELLPIRVSNRFTTSLIVDLLLLKKGSKYHLVLLGDLQKLVKYLPHKVHVCWICENELSDNEQVVLDFCHYTNKFMGWAHNECNIIRKTTNYIPVEAQYLSNYDFRFIIKALAKKDSEKFIYLYLKKHICISLTTSVYIKTYTNKNGKVKKTL